MKLLLASAALAALTATAVQAAPQVQQMLYNVDAAAQCSAAADDRADLKAGLSYCDVALSDPVMNHQAALLSNRGVIKVRLGNNQGALEDYNAAIAIDPALGDAYVSRAGVLIAMKRYDEARADVAQGIALGAANLHAAYFSRAVIAEESGDVKAAYRDYKQALAIKPDYAAASRELARFKIVQRAARL
ncbi:MAG: Tetratricopeptide 2 repeat protein [Alphaproteobacteria bacterium]|nr:Tetratricopeptide 2 repeat protein [Alphaproteobacteria bacterium]MDB5741342.1 Tetratricopeptide 2 repeat protein [Alphaproteobacteria bacterium]